MTLLGEKKDPKNLNHLFSLSAKELSLLGAALIDIRIFLAARIWKREWLSPKLGAAEMKGACRGGRGGARWAEGWVA